MFDDCVCVLSDLTRLPLHDGGSKSVRAHAPVRAPIYVCNLYSEVWHIYIFFHCI